jgi:hypothetical protein
MRFDYVVTLKKNNEKLIDWTSLFLCCFSVLFLIHEQIRMGKLIGLMSTGALIIFAGVTINLVAAWRKKPLRFKNLLLLAGIFWIASPDLRWISLIYFALEFLEHQAKRPLEIGFSPVLIEVNSWPKKKYSWTDFNNVMLKDGLLTLDFRNNKLYQKETLPQDEDDADEDEFNAYCRTQLGALGKLR